MTSTSSADTPIIPTLNGANILVKQLVQLGVEVVFAYPGGTALPLHQAYTNYKDKLRVILPRHEQGGAFAAQGYARSTGKVGVVSATSGPGAANLLTAIADAKMDSIPMVIITGQVSQNLIGMDAFQEMPTSEVFRSVTKHFYMIKRVKDVSRIVREAFHLANTGRKGPVLIDFPKDVQLDTCEPDFEEPMKLAYYDRKLPNQPSRVYIDAILESLHQANRPVILAGGGVISSGAAEQLTEFARRYRIPVATTLMGLGAFPADDPLSLHMIGMHGTAFANRAVHESDLLIVLGSRLSDRVTGKFNRFAPKARVIHIDIDASEINKVIPTSIGLPADIKQLLQMLLGETPELESLGQNPYHQWLEELETKKQQLPLKYNPDVPYILPQQAIEELCRQSQPLDPIITTGVGQHQMWTAQYFRTSRPRQILTSGGAGTMGFGLPAAMGAKAAFPNKTVLCIDGDGSALMNIQEMATCYCEKLPVKVMILNNQHLGMVVQMENLFCGGNRAQTYLGPVSDPEAVGQGSSIFGSEHRYPDFVTLAKGFGWSARSIYRKEDVSGAIEELLNADGPYLLDVMVPYKELVLPMIPGGATVDEMILAAEN